VDFTVNTSTSNGFEVNPSDDTARINCYDVKPDAGRLTGTTVGIVQIKPDSSVARVLDSVRAQTDSLAACIIPPPTVPWDPERLAGALIQGVLAAKLADGFLCDSLFVSDFRAPDDVGALVGAANPAASRRLSSICSVTPNWPNRVLNSLPGRSGQSAGTS
jgi:hypothetical protein